MPSEEFFTQLTEKLRQMNIEHEKFNKQHKGFIKQHEEFIKRLMAEEKERKAQEEDRQDYIKDEATGFEKEITLAVRSYLSNNVMGMRMYSSKGLPPFLFHPTTSEILTDLDGVVIMTNDPVDETFYDEIVSTQNMPLSNALAREKYQYAKSLKTSSSSKNDVTTQFIVVEAKHYMTKDRVDKKLKQLEAIEEYLKYARTLPNTVTPKFRKNVVHFRYDKFDENVQLFIGGPLWDKEALDAINKAITDKPRLRDIIHIVHTSGNRYAIANAQTSFRLKL